ncbi:5191_t:CDS:2, partial [Cetraspora pellucida]
DSTQKCREWLLSLVECGAEECEDETEQGRDTSWIIEDVGLTTHNGDAETWWDLNEEFEAYMVLEEVSDKEGKDIKLNEYLDLKDTPSERTVFVVGNELESYNVEPIKFRKLTIGYHISLRFTHLTRSYGKHCGYRLVAHDLRKLSILPDWIVKGARQELAQREYLWNIGIDLGYTEPLDESAISADSDTQSDDKDGTETGSQRYSTDDAQLPNGWPFWNGSDVWKS